MSGEHRGGLRGHGRGREGSRGRARCRVPPFSFHGDVNVVTHAGRLHAWLTVQMRWQMHGRTLQAVCKLIVYTACSIVLVHRSVGIAQDCAHRDVDCVRSMNICAHIVIM